MVLFAFAYVKSTLTIRNVILVVLSVSVVSFYTCNLESRYVFPFMRDTFSFSLYFLTRFF